jgi:hypothetical protein
MYRLIKKDTKEIINRSRTPVTIDGSQPVGLHPDYAWLEEIRADTLAHDSRIFSVETEEVYDLEAFTVTAKHELVRREPAEIINSLVGILHRKQDSILPSRSRERLTAACLYEVIAHLWPDLADAPPTIQNGLQILGAVESNEAWYSTIEAKVIAGTVTTADLDS